jgi:hypothetical protein
MCIHRGLARAVLNEHHIAVTVLHARKGDHAVGYGTRRRPDRRRRRGDRPRRPARRHDDDRWRLAADRITRGRL